MSRVVAGPSTSNVERLVRHYPLEPPVLFLQLPEPAHLPDLNAAVLAPPGVEGCVRDAVPLAQLRHLRSGLLPNADDLFFTEPRSFHAYRPPRQTLTDR